MNKGFKQFLVKTGIFITLFILFSIVIGSQLYQHGILENWKIEIYGRIGYILLFSIVGFILLYREKLLKFNKYEITKTDIFALFCSLVFLFLFYMFEVNAYKFEISFLKLILIHFIGIGIFAFLALGVYGVKFIDDFIKKFKKEIIYFLIFGVIVYSFMNLVFDLWRPLSYLVLNITRFLLGFGNVLVVNSDILVFEGFAVKIAEACSGIYSIFIFSALYIFAVLLDWKKLNHKKAILMFIPAVIGAFLVNVLRVFLMMVIGGYLSEGVALGLYHSYTGMIFFLVYFFIFWKLSYGWMKK
jgi:exosortase/archaeosortase family protein